MNENTPVSPGQPGNPSDPMMVPATAAGEGVAERYVVDELKKARATLRTTSIVAGIGVLSLALYMGYMTYRVVQYAQPDQAAEVATGLIAERVNTQAYDLSEQFKTKIPEVMAQLPDQAIERMPEVREALVARIESDLRTHAAKSSEEMGKHLDEFLVANKDQIKTVMEVGADREALKSIGPALEQELMGYLDIKPEGGGDSIKDSVDKSLNMLRTMKVKTDRLASNQGLTLEERKTRRAIAIITRTVNKETRGLNVKQAVLEAVDGLSTNKTLTGAVDSVTGGKNLEIPASAPMSGRSNTASAAPMPGNSKSAASAAPMTGSSNPASSSASTMPNAAPGSNASGKSANESSTEKTP